MAWRPCPKTLAWVVVKFPFSPTRIANRFAPPPFGATLPSAFVLVFTWMKYVPGAGFGMVHTVYHCRKYFTNRSGAPACAVVACSAALRSPTYPGKSTLQTIGLFDGLSGVVSGPRMM